MKKTQIEDVRRVETEIKSITETIQATDLPAVPAPAASADEYGGADNSQAAVNTALAIERACDLAVAEFARAADQAEEKARRVRAESDHFAEQLRHFTRGFTGRLGDFIVFCEAARAMAEQHTTEFEEKIAAISDPRRRAA